MPQPPKHPICASVHSRVASKEFWVNVYYHFNGVMGYGQKHISRKNAVDFDAGSIYRIHVKMKNKT